MANPKHLERLLKSAKEGNECKAWNKWVEKNFGIEIDLEGADLQYGNFQCADLFKANLQNSNLQGANFKHANVEQANLKNSNLFGAYFQNAYLGGANLQKANLQFANFQFADLQYANFEGANLQFANLSNASVYASKFKVSSAQNIICASLELRENSGDKTLTFTPSQVEELEKYLESEISGLDELYTSRFEVLE